MFPGADHRQLPLAVDGPTDGGKFDALLTGKIGAGKRFGVLQQVCVATAVHHLAAMLPGGGPDIDNPVGVGDGVLVMLDNDQRVAQIPEPREGFNQTPVIALMQPDRRLIEHIEHADETGADLGGQPDALRLTAGERSGGPGQREVVQADVEQEAQPGLHLLKYLPGDRLFTGAQGEFVEEVGTLPDGQLAHGGDGLRIVAGRQRHGQDLRLEPGAVALRARDVAHEPFVAFLHQLRIGLFQPALQKRHDSFEVGVIGTRAAVAISVAHMHLFVATLEDRRARLSRELAPRGVHVEPHRLPQPGQHAGEVLRTLPHRPRCHRTIGQGAIRIGYDEFGIDLLANAKTAALRARAVGRIERKRPRLKIIHRQRVTVRTRKLLGEALFAMRVAFLTVDEIQHHDAVGQTQRGLHRIGQPLFGTGLDGQPVDDHLDIVLFLLLQRRRLGQGMHHTVDPNPAVALGVQLVEEVDELALAGPHHRSEHLKLSALGHGQHLIDDLLRGLSRDPLATHRAVRRAGTRVEQTQVVVDLGDSADGGARVAVGGFLVDGYRRRKPLDEVDVGLVHLTEELPRIGAQGFDIATLTLGEDGIECQRRLARPGQAGEHDQCVPGKVEVDAAEVVLARSLDDQPVSHPPMLCGGPRHRRRQYRDVHDSRRRHLYRPRRVADRHAANAAGRDDHQGLSGSDG